MDNPQNHQYLGDGLYVKLDGEMVMLYTFNGIEITNTIYLEPETVITLSDFLILHYGTLLKEYLSCPPKNT